MTPPLHDPVIERALVGLALIDGEAAQQVAAISECFEDKDAARVARVIRAVVDGGAHPSPMIVGNALGGSQPDRDMLTDLVAESSGVVFAETPADIVRRDWTRREARRRATTWVQRITACDGDIRELLGAMAADIDGISPMRTGGIKTLQQAVGAAVEQVSYTVETGNLPGVTTGWRTIDKWVRYPRRELSLVAARPSMGKSSFAVQSAVRIARAGQKVVLFSLEDGAETVGARHLWQETQLNQYTVKRDDYGRMLDVRDGADSGSLRIVDLGGLTVPHMRQLTREIEREIGKIDLVMIDHGGYIVYEGDNEVNRISRMTKYLVSWIKDGDDGPACLMAWQLSRALTGRDDKRPTQSDLRGSGTLEEDARRLLFLHRDAYYQRDYEASDPKQIEDAEVIIAKNSTGMTGTIPFKFRRSTNTFYEVGDDHGAAPQTKPAPTAALPRPKRDTRSWHDEGDEA